MFHGKNARKEESTKAVSCPSLKVRKPQKNQRDRAAESRAREAERARTESYRQLIYSGHAVSGFLRKTTGKDPKT